MSIPRRGELAACLLCRVWSGAVVPVVLMVHGSRHGTGAALRPGDCGLVSALRDAAQRDETGLSPAKSKVNPGFHLLCLALQCRINWDKSTQTFSASTPPHPRVPRPATRTKTYAAESS